MVLHSRSFTAVMLIMLELAIQPEPCTTHMFISVGKDVLVCATPKIACSSQYDYLRWLYLTPESACKKGPTHVPGAIEKCAAIGIPINGSHHDHHDSPRYTRHKKISVEGPLIFHHMWSGKNTVPPKASTVVIGIRDPFVRAISGFRSKFEQDCENNEHCFQSNFAKMYDSTAVTNRSTLEKFFLSLPKTSQKVRTLNLHFKEQHKQCLGRDLTKYLEKQSGGSGEESGPRLVPADIDHNGLDMLSTALRQNQTYTNYMGGGYTRGDFNIKDSVGNSINANVGYRVSAKTLKTFLDNFLMPDYAAIKRRFGVDYATFGLLTKMTESSPDCLIRTSDYTMVCGEGTLRVSLK